MIKIYFAMVHYVLKSLNINYNEFMFNFKQIFFKRKMNVAYRQKTFIGLLSTENLQKVAKNYCIGLIL